MRIVPYAALGAAQRERLADLSLAAALAHSPEWMRDLDEALEVIAEHTTGDGVARVLVDGDRPLAWIAAHPLWGRAWELEPLLVAIPEQGRGHGRRLVREIEALAAAAGALTMLVGTSDVRGETSLAGVDLYVDTHARLGAAEVGRHAAAFWLRVGYRIVGVVPDAEGPGKPSITLARRLAP